MICKDYTQFRHRFSNDGVIAVDGHPSWPANQTQRIGGFAPINGPGEGFPFSVQVFPTDVPTDVYLSQGTDDEALHLIYCDVLHLMGTVNVRVRITFAGMAAIGRDPDEDPLTAEELRILFEGTHLYAKNTVTGDVVSVDLYADLGGDE